MLDKHFMEPKRRSEPENPEVQAKAEAARLWHQYATEHARQNEGKPWRYLLVLPDGVRAEMSLQGFAIVEQNFSREEPSYVSSPAATPATLSSLRRHLRLEIDQASWPPNPNACSPRFPPEFAPAATRTAVDFMDAMRWVGYFSVPRTMPNWADATRWAQIKYLSALDFGENDLRLHAAVEDVDLHPKGILSDDWGVGLSVSWLQQVFGYRYIAHGRRFLRYLERRRRGRFGQPTARTGRGKCPDFGAFLPGGRYHLIECKGTTKSPSFLTGQLAAAVEQKGNFDWTAGPSRIDQRLAVGVYVAGARSTQTSLLSVRDPDFEGVPKVAEDLNEDRLSLPLRWDMLLGGLMSCGFHQLASRLMDEELDREAVNALRTFALADGVAAQRPSESDRWFTNGLHSTLPAPVKQGGQVYTNAISRASVRRELVEALYKAVDKKGGERIEQIVDSMTKDYPLHLEHRPISLKEDHLIGRSPGELRFGDQFRFEFFLM